MTNKDFYQELLKAGAPELPNNLFYIFGINKKKEERFGVNYRETANSRSLYVKLREKHLGGLFYETLENWYMPRNELDSPYGTENQRALDRGTLKVSDLDGTYKIAHMALLAEDAYNAHLDKSTQGNNDPAGASIFHFLGKRLP